MSLLKFKNINKDNREYLIKVAGKEITVKLDQAVKVGAAVYSNISILKYDLNIDIIKLERKLIDNSLWGDNKEKILLLSDIEVQND